MANNITSTRKINRGFAGNYLEERCRRVQERYVRKIPNGCWEGTSWTNRDGYCFIYVNGKDVPLHRFMYEVLVGEIPEGKYLDHKCSNRRCCNPEHLEPVTQKENVRRGKAYKHGKYAKEALNG